MRTDAVAPRATEADGCWDVAAFCDEFVQALRGGEAIAGRHRAAALTVLTAWNAWPARHPVRLHTEGDNSGRRYGPRDHSAGHVESIHVKHCADGRYATADRIDDDWVDFGASPDGLFEALLEGLQRRIPAEHRTLTNLKTGNDTDAHWMRKALAAVVDENRTAAMEALKPVFERRRTPDAPGPVDGQLLRELLDLGQSRFMNLGRTWLARTYNVAESTIRGAITFDGELRVRGRELLRRMDDPDYRAVPIDATTLQDIATRGLADDAALVAQAKARGVSMTQLDLYYKPGVGLTDAGRDLIAQAAWRSDAKPVRAQPDLARWQQVMEVLRGDAVIDGYARHVTLLLLPTMASWPAHLEILLHTNGAAPARHYQPPAGSTRPRETIHIKQWPDGRYAAADRGDAPPDQWMDCGAFAHGLFNAVLGALWLHSQPQYYAFAAPWRNDVGTTKTYPHRLRERLADDVAQRRPSTIQALASVTRLPKPPDNGFREVDAWMLQDMAGTRGGESSLHQLAARYGADYNVLRRYLSAYTFQPTPGGAQFIKRQEDASFVPIPLKPAILRDIRAKFEEGIGKHGGFAKVVDSYPVSYFRAVHFIDPVTGTLTVLGEEFIGSDLDRPDDIQGADFRPVTAAAAVDGPDWASDLMDIEDVLPAGPEVTFANAFPDDLAAIPDDDDGLAPLFDAPDSPDVMDLMLQALLDLPEDGTRLDPATSGRDSPELMNIPLEDLLPPEDSPDTLAPGAASVFHDLS